MKKVIFLLAVISVALAASAQTTDSVRIDSNKLYVKNVAMQARDLESLTSLLTSSELYEDMYNIAATKFRVNTPPSGNDVVTLDSVRVDALLGISQYIRSVPYVMAVNFSSRVDNTLKAIPNTYLQRILASIDAMYVNSYQDQRKEGKRRLRGIRN